MTANGKKVKVEPRYRFDKMKSVYERRLSEEYKIHRQQGPTTNKI